MFGFESGLIMYPTYVGYMMTTDLLGREQSFALNAAHDFITGFLWCSAMGIDGVGSQISIVWAPQKPVIEVETALFANLMKPRYVGRALTQDSTRHVKVCGRQQKDNVGKGREQVTYSWRIFWPRRYGVTCAKVNDVIGVFPQMALQC